MIFLRALRVLCGKNNYGMEPAHPESRIEHREPSNEEL